MPEFERGFSGRKETKKNFTNTSNVVIAVRRAPKNKILARLKMSVCIDNVVTVPIPYRYRIGIIRKTSN